MKKIYVCGPTVYAPMHIGNMRPLLYFDIFNRALSHLGEEIYYVHNITDIDDKIIAKAKELNVTEKEVSEKWDSHYKELIIQLNVNIPDAMPNVTENMDMIINFIKKVVDKNDAYVSNGDVYFDISKNKKLYGTISNQKIDEMQYDESKNKKHPADFAMWKKTDEGITFESPWSKGRPGWHTECVAFIDYLFHGETLDFHGGGIDLIFPHHENENIQYESANGIKLSNEWLHTGHLNITGKKMSKSEGELITASTFLKTYDIDTLRMIFLLTSPTSPIDINDDLIEFAESNIGKFRKAFKQANMISKKTETETSKKIAEMITKRQNAIAQKEINNIIKMWNKDSSKQNADAIISTMNLLGFVFTKYDVAKDDVKIFNEWEELVKAQDYKAADELRKILKAKELL